jgi:hypothetical protein
MVSIWYDPAQHKPGPTGVAAHTYDALCNWHVATIGYWRISNYSFASAAVMASMVTMCPNPMWPFPDRDFQNDYDQSLVNDGQNGQIHFTPDDCLMIFGYGGLKIRDYNAGQTAP